MKINDYFKVTIASIIISFGTSILSGNILIGIISFFISLLLLTKYKKFIIKHDIEIETKYIKESLEKQKKDKNINE